MPNKHRARARNHRASAHSVAIPVTPTGLILPRRGGLILAGGGAYAMIRNHADGIVDSPRHLAIVELTKTKIPQAHIQLTTRTANDFTVYRNIVANVATAIRAGLFHPAPSMFCNSCSVRRNCPAYRNN